MPPMKDFLHDRLAKRPSKKEEPSGISKGNPFIVGGIALLVALALALFRIYGVK